MTTSTKNTETGLKLLALLLDIPTKRGWRTKLAKWFGVELRTVSKWIERDRVPKKRIEQVEARGYPASEWLIEENDDIVTIPPGAKNGLKLVQGYGLSRERRAPWHSEPRKNQLLAMAAYILNCDHPELTPELEQKIVEVHTALIQPGTCEPKQEKKENPA